MTREAWLATGFGDTPFSEDKFIQCSLQRLGFRIVALRAPNAWHGHSYSLRSLMKRCYNEGIGWRFVSVKYPALRLAYDLVVPPLRLRKTFIRGVRMGRVRDPASLLFLQLRPVLLFVGNRVISRYWR